MLLGKAYLAAGVGGVGFFAMSVLLLGVWPGQVLQDETQRMSPKYLLKLSASEERGRVIYSRDGCAYCHTQQIRFLEADAARFGKPTQAWETQFDYPHLWGTRRIGPDLARESGAHSEDWQFSHLYEPRGVVPDSVMPAFSAFFDGAPDRPRQEARDLVAYLETLGRARLLVEPVETPGAAHSPVPVLDTVWDRARGDVVYTQNCAGCHGATGNGKGAEGLSPQPANLMGHRYSAARVAFALWNGVAGTSMPAWRSLSRSDLSAVAGKVRALHAAAEPVVKDDLETGRRVYADHCAECHGDTGAGDGPAGREIHVAPTNFVTQSPDFEVSFRAVRDGVPGTPMAPWSRKLPEAGVTAVASFVRTFYQP